MTKQAILFTLVTLLACSAALAGETITAQEVAGTPGIELALCVDQKAAMNNKVTRSYVEGLNYKIRVIQRRACGYRDEEYLRLKIVTAFLSRT